MGKQPIDADPTEEKPKRKLPKRFTDWPRIKREWQAGGQPTRIAIRHGIDYTTLWKKAKKEGWQREPIQPSQQSHPVATVQATPSPIQSAVKERLGKHFSTVLLSVESIQRGIDEHSMRRLEVEELKTLANTLDTVDRIARRTFGLDSPGGGSPGSLLATVAPAVLCPVVDVDPVPAQVLPAETGR